MGLEEAQKAVDKWISQYKEGYWPIYEMFARLTEEIGELAREINHRFGHKKKKAIEDKKEIADELGDLIFTICCIANSQRISLRKAFQKTMDKMYKRNGNRFKKK